MISSITLGIAEQPGTLETRNSVAGMLRSWSVSSSAFSLLCEYARARGTIVNQAQIQEELGVSEVVGECVCERLDTHRRLDTERLLHHT